MSTPVKADIELFLAQDRDITVPITVDGAPDTVTALGKVLTARNLYGDLVLTKNGSTSPTSSSTCLFPIVPGDFGSGKLVPGQYNYGVHITDSGRTYLATYGRLTVSLAP